MKPIFILSCAVVLTTYTEAAAQSALSLTQARCREMALEHNEELQHADNSLRQAELDKAIAFTAYLPKFEGSATVANVFENIDMMGMELRMKGIYMAGINLMQPIYAGGKITAGNRLARIGAECAAENLRKTRMDVIADADDAYWTYIATLRKIEMLEAYSRQMDTLLRQTENSLSAEWQNELAMFLAGAIREFCCQLVIATHSPFLLSLPGAKVYDLDAEPIQACKWYKLKNMRSYFELFERNRALFEE